MYTCEMLQNVRLIMYYNKLISEIGMYHIILLTNTIS